LRVPSAHYRCQLSLLIVSFCHRRFLAGLHM
jgi:hypothetical protein